MNLVKKGPYQHTSNSHILNVIDPHVACVPQFATPVIMYQAFLFDMYDDISTPTNVNFAFAFGLHEIVIDGYQLLYFVGILKITEFSCIDIILLYFITLTFCLPFPSDIALF